MRCPLGYVLGGLLGHRRGAVAQQLLDLLKHPPLLFGGRLQWTPQRMDAALADFVRGRTRWPTQSEFRSSGLSGLDGAIARRGGARYWARRIGFTRNINRRIMKRSSPYQPPAALPADPDLWVRAVRRRSDAVWTDEAIVQAIRH